MLQIIGLLGCVYLTVKGFELIGHSKTKVDSGAYFYGGLIAFVGAAIFCILLIGQGKAVMQTEITPTSVDNNRTQVDTNTVLPTSGLDTANAVTNADIGQNIVFPK